MKLSMLSRQRFCFSFDLLGQSISKAGSILNFWAAEPTFSSGSGIVQFEGGALRFPGE